MAMEVCFQACTSARASVLQSHYPFSSKEKVNLLPCKAVLPMAMMKSSGAASLFTSSSSSSAHSFNKKCRSSRIVCKASIDEVRVVTDKNWSELVTGSDTTVLVEFWAPWCGPCRMIAPVVDELAKEYAGKAQCFKLNTDDCPSIASQYGIRSIPTVLFFKKGEKKESVIGAVPKSTLSAALDKYVES